LGSKDYENAQGIRNFENFLYGCCSHIGYKVELGRGKKALNIRLRNGTSA
jgi:hypothetical protein